MGHDKLDEAQDNFQDAAGEMAEEAGNIAEESWEKTKRVGKEMADDMKLEDTEEV